MKKRIQISIIFAALICMSLSGCNEPTATPTSTQSSTEPTAKTSVTTVTSVAEVIETTEIYSTAVETETVTNQNH